MPRVKTFRIGDPRTNKKAFRIAVTRRTIRGVAVGDLKRVGKFDNWFPLLAPSAELLAWLKERNPAHPKVMGRFFAAYRKELFKKAESRQALDLLLEVSKRTPVEIGCFCEREDQCHRSELLRILRELSTTGEPGLVSSRSSLPHTPSTRWTKALREGKALSVRQPWSWLIVHGFKDVENRSRRTSYRGPLLIHAGLSKSDFDEEAYNDIERKYGVTCPEEAYFGGIVGVVDLVDCVKSHPSAWYERGNYAWVLKNPRRLSFRECKGQLGIFKPTFPSAS